MDDLLSHHAAGPFHSSVALGTPYILMALVARSRRIVGRQNRRAELPAARRPYPWPVMTAFGADALRLSE
jgi:hypothetical protein